MICVCVPIALKKNEAYITLIVQCSPFPFKGSFLLDLLAKSFFEASNHQPMTINQIQEKHNFNKEYMPIQPNNLTISPFGKFHVKTPIQIQKQLQRIFSHNEYNDLHILTKFPTSVELHLGLLLISPKK